MPDQTAFSMPAAFPCIRKTGATKTRFGENPHFKEGLYDLGHSTYAWMVPNGSWGEANAGLILGDGAAGLVDTLWDHKTTQKMLDTLKQEFPALSITTLINTHADGDHFFGNALLQNADSITSHAALADMTHVKPGQMLALAKLGKAMALLPSQRFKQASRWFCAMGRPYDFAGVTHCPAKRGFSGQTELEIGGRQVELIEVGSAHTSGDLIVHLPDARIVFAADILFLGSTPVMWAGPVENWLRALDKIDALEAHIIVPGHGPVTDAAGVALVRRYWQFIQPLVHKHYKSGLPPRAAAFCIAQSDAFQNAPFARWDSPERLMTNSYMLYRQFSGRTGHPPLPLLLKILFHQAQLAHVLLDAAPRVMRAGKSLRKKS